MKNTIRKYFSHTFVLLLSLLIMGSCTKMDDNYKDLIKSGEISYSGLIENLTVFSGHNRVQVQGDLVADPKITEVRIFWNNNQDSISVPILTIPYHLDVKLENLDENIYNFEVRTYDKFGNKSIPVTSIGKVFGNNYIFSLINRPIKTTAFVGATTDLKVNFGTMDTTTGVYETVVTYTNTSDELVTVTVPYFIYDPILKADKPNPSVTLPAYKSGSFSYQTFFKPDSSTIDIFNSEVTTVLK